MSEEGDYFSTFYKQLIMTTRRARIFLVTFPQSRPGLPQVAVLKEFPKYDPDQVREVAMLMHLKDQHPHIINLYHYKIVGKAYCLFMEYCEGGSLAQEIARRRKEMRPWTSKELRDMYLDLADAMTFLHAQRILHRDIKPDNIFMTRDGTLKVADFGECKQVRIQGTDIFQSLRGTRDYMSPELTGAFLGVQSWPTNESGYTDDVWAMGITFYEMAMGEMQSKWREGEEESGFVERIKQTLLRKKLSVVLIRLVIDMLRLKPENRPNFQTIRERLRRIPSNSCANCAGLMDSVTIFPCKHEFCSLCFSSFQRLLASSPSLNQVNCPVCHSPLSLEELKTLPLSAEAVTRLRVLDFLQLSQPCSLCAGSHPRFVETRANVLATYVVMCKGKKVCSCCGKLGAHSILGVKRRCPSSPIA